MSDGGGPTIKGASHGKNITKRKNESYERIDYLENVTEPRWGGEG